MKFTTILSAFKKHLIIQSYHTHSHNFVKNKIHQILEASNPTRCMTPRTKSKLIEVGPSILHHILLASVYGLKNNSVDVLDHLFHTARHCVFLQRIE